MRWSFTPGAMPRMSAMNDRKPARSHFAIGRRALGQVADAALGLQRLCFDVEAADADAALGGGQEAGDHLHRRRLAGAVGTQEAEDFAGADGETHLVDGQQIPVSLRQILDFYHFLMAREWLAGKPGRDRWMVVAT
jgi:hypothetical protein